TAAAPSKDPSDPLLHSRYAVGLLGLAILAYVYQAPVWIIGGFLLGAAAALFIRLLHHGAIGPKPPAVIPPDMSVDRLRRAIVQTGGLAALAMEGLLNPRLLEAATAFKLRPEQLFDLGKWAAALDVLGLQNFSNALQ